MYLSFYYILQKHLALNIVFKFNFNKNNFFPAKMITFPTQSPHRKTDSRFFFFFKLFDRKLIYKEYPSECNGACMEKTV